MFVSKLVIVFHLQSEHFASQEGARHASTRRRKIRMPLAKRFIILQTNMKVFVTGASGYIGSNIVEQLVASGHTVTALVRSPSAVDKVTSLGATPIQGDHTDLELLRQSVKDVDAAIHTAFNHSLFTQPNGFAQVFEQDRAVISTICDTFIGTGKTFVNSSGVLGNATDDEFSEKEEGLAFGLRFLSEKLLFSYAERGVRTINIRLSPVVHGGNKENAFIAGMIAAAKKSGFAGYVGEGANIWPAVHVKDAAALYALALTSEKVKPGSNLNAVAETGTSTKEIAEFIAQKLGVKAKSVDPADAAAHWGFIAGFIQSGRKTTTKYTREWTGWEPKGPGLFEDLEDYMF
ncbi:NAD-dependent epimerase/dehydratase [Flagelloscypha sp. PMI_526]|nr:NAD-dependent epimerase/dehydratase [Flagelloscypha sp. PMI_526]